MSFPVNMVGQDNVNIGVVTIFRQANTSLLQVYTVKTTTDTILNIYKPPNQQKWNVFIKYNLQQQVEEAAWPSG